MTEQRDGQFYVKEDGTVLDGGKFESGLYARKLHEDGRPYGTFRTYALLVTGNQVVLRNLTIANTSGPGAKVGQAIALYGDGDELQIENCRILGHQDTLFLAPLPPAEIQKDGFLGPGQFTERKRRRVYVKNCLIEGGVDFVFGGAEAFFEDCEFRSVEPGYVFAPCTPEEQEEGFVCLNCRFTSVLSLEAESCYLGRPWRDFAKVRLENCYLGAHIKKEGWHDWNKPLARERSRFVENGSYGPGAEKARRPEWVEFHPLEDWKGEQTS